MNPKNLLTVIPLAVATAFTLSVSPLEARDHGKGGGGGHHKAAPAAHHRAAPAHKVASRAHAPSRHVVAHHSVKRAAVVHRSPAVVHRTHHRVAPVVVHNRHDRVIHRDWRHHYRPYHYGVWGVGLTAPVYSYSAAAGPVYSDAADSTAVAVQQALADEGYYNGAVDGIVGPGTSSAIAAYQRDHGLAATGSIDAALLQSLGIS